MTRQQVRLSSTCKGYHPLRVMEMGLAVSKTDFYVRDRATNEVRLMTDAEWDAAMRDSRLVLTR